MSHWLSHLNPEQREAAQHNFGPLLILAGAGSGKTTVLVSRTGRLIEEKLADPKEICVLTFTNKAARELKSRVAKKCGALAKPVWAGTFHSFGLYILKLHHEALGLPKKFGVIDPQDAGHLLKEELSHFHLGDKSSYDSEILLNTLSQFRESGRREALHDNDYETAIEWALPRYEKRLKQLAVVDFDDLLLKPLSLLQQDSSVAKAIRKRFSQCMVDEFQDTNAIQMKLIRELTRDHRNLAVVGDDDQSIYGWRGAQIENILNFPKLYKDCKVVKLERNYRSSPAILQLANACIKKNTKRHSKTLLAQKSEFGLLPEVIVYSNETEEAEGVAADISIQLSKGTKPSEISVLFRSNQQSALIEAELRRMSIPYSLSGGMAFFDRKEIRDVIAYLKCSLRIQDLPFRRIFNTPPRGLGDKTIEQIETFSQSRQIPFGGAARTWKEIGLDSRSGKAIDDLFLCLEGLKSVSTSTGLMQFLKQIGYPSYLEKVCNNSLVSQKRWKHLQIFSDIFEKHLESRDLESFLDRMDLRDAPESEKEDEIQLMTLHACKGLEFEWVYFLGVEEDLIPHKRLGSDASEERRLFYVGVTRAKSRLVLTRCHQRRKQGKVDRCVPSRFLLDIPGSHYQEHFGQRPSEGSNRKALLDGLYKQLDRLGV